MAALELLALLGLFGFAGFGVNSVRLMWKGHVKKKDAMRDDLREALAAHDHRKLDDFMVLWAGGMDGATLKHVKARRDELFIEDDANSRH
jgi:hypothetical protein